MRNWKITFWILLWLWIPLNGIAQNKDIDVQHYKFQLELSDENNQIKGNTEITFLPLKAATEVWFDLEEFDEENGKGMKVISVESQSGKTKFYRKDDKVFIQFHQKLKSDKPNKVTIHYEGIPSDGLIIDHNRYGKRTFFTDNWPNRAHHWIPVNDHPSDKASVEFIVTAPDHYKVVGNGVKLEEKNLPGQMKRTHWKESKVLPVKVMAIGVADFSVTEAGKVRDIPVETWVFSDNKESGFEAYSPAPEILSFYEDYLAPYPYEKLANVQSKTIFGGMENASNIFYSEDSVSDDIGEYANPGAYPIPLIAHEIAHQWFGNEVSEFDWPHLWLSEGFATYLTQIYMEKTYGKEVFHNRLKTDRDRVTYYHKIRQTPIVDEIGALNPMEMLNPNSYQKAGWVLHMLRQEIGEESFRTLLQTFYNRFKTGNATTEDFRQLTEELTEKDWKLFFNQWLYTSGHPVLELEWNYDETADEINLSVIQKQEFTFVFPLEIEFKSDNRIKTEHFQIEHKTSEFKIPFDSFPTQITPDPEVKLLFEYLLKKE